MQILKFAELTNKKWGLQLKKVIVDWVERKLASKHF